MKYRIQIYLKKKYFEFIPLILNLFVLLPFILQNSVRILILLYFFFFLMNKKLVTNNCAINVIEVCYRSIFLFLPFFFSGCHEQGYAGNVIVYGICVRSIGIWTRCSASHIQIGPRLACLNLLAMQPSTPISAYHHIKIIHIHIHTWLYCENAIYAYSRVPLF